jgi:hypothetical protein
MTDLYNWGQVEYDPQGLVDSISFTFLPGGDDRSILVRPHSPAEALEMVGLQATSEPKNIAGFYRWCPTCPSPFDSPPLICCGIKFDSVTVWVQGGNISTIEVSGKSHNESAE